ncbi:hypothetical protein C806_03282 [Lachnospiraceae bacterium 3-1]|nr:hypothetical protein C806_03282 [Lachnospiraceae bacterium 3-1]
MDKNTASYKRMDKTILNAFIEISQQIPFENITVQKIADVAYISRYTFYVHFHDKYEVAERIQDELYREFTQFIQKQIPAIHAATATAEEHWQMMDIAILRFSQKHIGWTQSIWKIHTETIDFSKRIKTFLADNYKSRFPDHENLDLEAMLYANMAMTLTEHYIGKIHTPNMNQTITSSYIYAFLYAIGIHEEHLLKKEYNHFMQLIYPETSLSS